MLYAVSASASTPSGSGESVRTDFKHGQTPSGGYLRPPPCSPPFSLRFFLYFHLLSVQATYLCSNLLFLLALHQPQHFISATGRTSPSFLAMHFLTPKFVLVAMLASLTAFSLAPPADAAAIAMRRGNQQHISDSSGTRSGSSASHLSHPVLPLPARLTSASGKQTKDDSDTSSRGSMKVRNGS